MKILIVDDDLEVVHSLGNAFTTLLRGYLVLTATSANQGLNFIKQERPDVIIMDVRLGPKSGMDLLEDYAPYFKDYRPGIVVITAYDDPKAKEKSEKLKVDAFLMKPLKKDVLFVAVLEALRKQLESKIRSIDLALQGFKGRGNTSQQSKDELAEKMKQRPKTD